MTTRSGLIALAAAALLGACGPPVTPSPVQAPGDPASMKTRALEAGAAMLQDKPPIDALNAYLDGFHFYNGRPGEQMEAHHYCAVLNDDVIQCAIYDGNQRRAKLMGVEYIVSEALFRDLPDEEKALWHSHVHEVKSGQLIAPGIPEIAEKQLMAKLIGTYGKTWHTWHTWHTDADKALPLGVPQLMMGFTADGQADPSMVANRDQRFGISSAQKQANRADIPAPPIDPGADAWRHGKTYQIADPARAHAHGANATATGAAPKSGAPHAR